MQILYQFMAPRDGEPWQLWEFTPGAEPPKVEEVPWQVHHDHARAVCEALGTVVKRDGESRLA